MRKPLKKSSPTTDRQIKSSRIDLINVDAPELGTYSPFGNLQSRIKRQTRKKEAKFNLLGLSGTGTLPEVVANVRQHLATLLLPNQHLDAREVALALVESIDRDQKKLRLKSIPSVPPSAPEAWAERDRSKGESPVEFINRVYKKWIKAGVLSRADLLTLDEPLYKAYGVRISRDPNEAIAQLEDQTDWVDAAVAKLSHLYTADEIRRIGVALDKRQQRAKAKTR